MSVYVTIERKRERKTKTVPATMNFFSISNFPFHSLAPDNCERASCSFQKREEGRRKVGEEGEKEERSEEDI